MTADPAGRDAGAPSRGATPADPADPGEPVTAGAGAVPGIRGEATTAWFTGHVPGARPPLAFQVIAGGHSNLTYLVRDAGGGSWVLRRPPLSRVLPSAHDMGREYRIISALRDTPVPVPEAIGLCEDPSVTGAPFYVMDYVDGIVPRDDQAVASTFDERQRAASARSLVEVLVALHAVEPDAVGLGDLGRREGYIDRQLRRWSRQWEQSKTRELPAMEEAGRRLAANVPAQQGPGTIVHGDYRLDNVIVSPTGEVRAVLDWELCTLGDPLADIGLLMVCWSDPGDEVLPLDSTVTALPGFPRRAEVADAYANASGRDLSQLDFYVAFGYWKLAAILEGVYARSAAGAYSGDDDTYRRFAAVVERLAERALDKDQAGEPLSMPTGTCDPAPSTPHRGDPPRSGHPRTSHRPVKPARPPPCRPYPFGCLWEHQLMTAPTKRWNHNLHYHPLILDAVPDGCQRALDIGCGEGILARELRRIVPHVSAIDLHQPSIRLAHQQDDGAGIDYLVGDFLTYPFKPASFDLIASVAALHHMDARVALARMRHLLRPGGRLAIIGLARSRYPVDLPRDAAATVGHLLHKATKGYWEISAPNVWPPPVTYAGMRRLAAELLPGVRYRRHLLWRYSLVWTKPTA